MGREYNLSKEISEKEAEGILRELREITFITKVEFVENATRLRVVTAEDHYLVIMNQAVNIFRRIGRGCELSFAGFVNV